MPGYLALLRGINVGGRNKVAMTDLRQLMTALGHRDVTTYIQTGNVVFSGPQTDADKIAGVLEREIAGRLGVPAAVIVLTRAELAQVIADNPFPGEANPKSLHAVFRQEDMTAEAIAAVAEARGRARAKGSPDDAVIVGRTLFLHTPNGLGRSELAARLARSGAQRGGTARNWATVTRLMSMLDAADSSGHGGDPPDEY